MYDVIIIGAGPAGISAGLYTKRAGLNTLVLYFGESSLEKAEKIENYYGFEEGISGKDLYLSGINQAKNLGVDIKNEEVLNISKEEFFKIETLNNEYKAKAVIIATGNKKVKPNIKGITEFEGRGVSYCAICDGFFYKGKNVVVIGNGNYALKEAEDLQNVVNSVKILSDGLEVKENRSFEVDTKKIKEIIGDEKVKEVEFEDGSKEDVDGIFVALGEASGIDFAKKLGVFIDDKTDSIKVNENMQTNIEGLFSCGNANGGLLQISKAVYEGSVAGIQVINYLKNI